VRRPAELCFTSACFLNTYIQIQEVLAGGLGASGACTGHGRNKRRDHGLELVVSLRCGAYMDIKNCKHGVSYMSRTGVYMRVWTAFFLVVFCVGCFEISKWTEARQIRRLTRASTLDGHDFLHRAHPVVLMRTHRSHSIEARVKYPFTGIVLPMLPYSSIQQTTSLMQTLTFFNRDSNLRFYIGAASETDATQLFDQFHNLTFDEYVPSPVEDKPQRYIEVIVLRIPHTQHGHTRLHALLAKSWSEMNDFILVVHGSCVVRDVWRLRDTAKSGNGYSMIAVSDKLNALQNFEWHIAKKFDHILTDSGSEKPIQCTKGIVQPLRLNF